ncbi:MAG TPA: hypothetical protein VLE02_01095 [Nitrosarchaeum sp.]|nr:hypothetical protein [Nitrosarchaeum sp.]
MGDSSSYESSSEGSDEDSFNLIEENTNDSEIVMPVGDPIPVTFESLYIPSDIQVEKGRRTIKKFPIDVPVKETFILQSNSDRDHSAIITQKYYLSEKTCVNLDMRLQIPKGCIITTGASPEGPSTLSMFSHRSIIYALQQFDINGKEFLDYSFRKARGNIDVSVNLNLFSYIASGQNNVIKEAGEYLFSHCDLMSEVITELCIFRDPRIVGYMKWLLHNEI